MLGANREQQISESLKTIQELELELFQAIQEEDRVYAIDVKNALLQIFRATTKATFNPDLHFLT